MQAGRRNGNRFIMSTASPVTPNTPVGRGDAGWHRADSMTAA
jgi:hypothetical protein